MHSKKSNEKRRVVLEITPQTWVRVTQKDKIFFRIPFDKLYPGGKKRNLRIMKYNDYKASILEEARKKQFELPYVGAGVIFCVPVPKSWSQKKKKLQHGEWKHTRPDLKNYLQGFEDALLKQDQGIAYYTHLGKRWVNAEAGWIEITITEPGQVFIEPPSIEGRNRLL
jgi:Holliday junction resolvase RusA-like endonuclease